MICVPDFHLKVSDNPLSAGGWVRGGGGQREEEGWVGWWVEGGRGMDVGSFAPELSYVGFKGRAPPQGSPCFETNVTHRDLSTNVAKLFVTRKEAS